MAVRNIVRIDEEKCTGCGLCATACAEGAIQIVNGKARLVSDSYCDGLGACLGHCPAEAITIEQREAAAFDEKAVPAHTPQPANQAPLFVCPGMAPQQFRKSDVPKTNADAGEVPSELTHWPVQLTLVSPTAPQFADADLLLAADCVPVAVGDFHRRFLKDHSIAIGCPKLDDTQVVRRETGPDPANEQPAQPDRYTHGSALLLRLDARGPRGHRPERQADGILGYHRLAARQYDSQRSGESRAVKPNSKSETSSKDRNPKLETEPGPATAFRSLRLWILDLFRISGFVLRISMGRLTLWPQAALR